MSILFEPKKIGTLLVKNRLVRAPTVEKMATDDGRCTPKLMDLYTRLAEGGVGMIITGGGLYPGERKGASPEDRSPPGRGHRRL